MKIYILAFMVLLSLCVLIYLYKPPGRIKREQFQERNNFYFKNSGYRIHLVMYSRGEPFDTTKRLTLESAGKYTMKELVIHDYNLEKIMNTQWFNKIKDLPQIDKPGKRDGYYNSWKAFITNDVYDEMEEGDLLYYIDSSQYYKTGFTENMDKLCDIAHKNGFIAGSVGDDVTNDFTHTCNNIAVWDKIIPGNDNSRYLVDMHVLNAWFILKKTADNTPFIKDWVKWTAYKDDIFTDPLVTYHHTGDQSIFNILVRKYNLPVFYSKDIKHNENKDKNCVLKTINNTETPDDYFIVL